MFVKEIFLDLDDTLNQFVMQALTEVGCIVNRNNPMSNYSPTWGWDIVKAANALHPHQTFTPEEFWKSFSKFFWASLPRSDEFDFLLEKSVELVGRDNICILSCPTDDSTCIAGKLEWIQEFCPRWLHRQYLLGPPKYLCAKPNAFLIDDNNDNVDKFHAKGGGTILVPRPWNRLHDINTMEHLAFSFRHLGSLK